MIFLALALLTYILVGILRPLFLEHLELNYANELIPSSLGLSFVLTSVLALLAQERQLAFTLTLLFFSWLGLIDDFLGSSEAKGFSGHFSSGIISTGMLKAAGALGFAVALNLSTRSFGEIILDSLLLPLTANFINLLDLRPGRAGKAFLLFALPLVIFGSGLRYPLLIVMGAVVGYLPWDLRADVMMGDTGSNALGAILGLCLALSLGGVAKILMFIVLLSLNLVAERVSYSKIIEANSVLNFLDRLGR